MFLGLGGRCAALCIRENILPTVRFRLCFLYLLSRPYGYDVLRVFIQQFFLSKRYLGFERQILLLMTFNSSILHTTWMLEDDHVRANFSEIRNKTFTTCLAFRCIFIRLYSGGRVVSLDCLLQVLYKTSLLSFVDDRKYFSKVTYIINQYEIFFL